MTIATRDKIVVLGMMTKLRVAGAIWQTLHYLIGLQRLGYEVYYVEAHGCVSWAFGDDEAAAAAFLDRTLRRFDLAGRWSFHARSGSGRYYGMSEFQVRQVCSEAAAILNLHGGTVPAAEHRQTERLIFIDTDPSSIQIEIHNGNRQAIELLEPHCAFFTFGENYGRSDCRLPVSERFRFLPTRQPVVLDLWPSEETDSPDPVTTIGNWQQLRRVVVFEGEEYLWSKHFEFLKFIDLPKRAKQTFELALSSCDQAARAMLMENGWGLRDASTFSLELDQYRDYVCRSRGEFTVAKDQNIRLRTGWFSDRSATYLAAGRPVVTQETGFSNILPVGDGLFAFSTMEQILSALERINADYPRQRRAAAEIARVYFSHEVVLGELLGTLGIPRRSLRRANRAARTVNVFGQLSGHTGISETVRRYSNALEKAGVRVNRCNPAENTSLGCVTADAVNVVCSDVPSQPALLAHMNQEAFRRGYNIGLWLWELGTIPVEWHDRFAYYDEIWAPTSFIARSLTSVSPIPVVTVPHVLVPVIRGDRDRGRRRLGLGHDTFVYGLALDFHSRIERKNPLAAISAFVQAFTPQHDAHLVLKCSNTDFNREYFEVMTKCAETRQVSLYTGQWTSQEIADFTAACDCYVSLHRAEGVGLTLGDAMAAGKPVIATGWSGNMDFMNVANSFPVRYDMVRLDRNVGYYKAGSLWAEPSVDHAAELMRYVFEHREEASARGRRAQFEIDQDYSTAAVSAIIRRRLALIEERNQFRRLREALRAPDPDPDGIAAEFAGLGEYVPERQLRYREVKRNLLQAVRDHTPAAATVLVVSRGDEDLLELEGRLASHFPQAEGGRYIGYHPKDAEQAIEFLESARQRGGGFLVFPETSFWWFEHYPEFHTHLQRHYPVTYADDFCRVFGLEGGRRP